MKLLDQVRDAIRKKHYTILTEQVPGTNQDNTRTGYKRKTGNSGPGGRP